MTPALPALDALLNRFESAELCAECGEKIGSEAANGCTIHGVFFHQRCCEIWPGWKECVHPLAPSRRALARIEAMAKGEP
jgi:predicted amidophosphoribosyltransferase